MSIEGDILTNAFGNSNAQQAYHQSLSTRDNIETDLPNKLPDEPLTANEQAIPRHPSTLNAALAEVTKGLNDKDTMTMADAVKMQVGVMKWQLQNELTSKVAGSVSNDIQTLMRNQ